MSKNKLIYFSSFQHWLTIQIRIFSILGFIAVIMACQRIPSEISTPMLDDSLTDRSVVTGLPCKAPCWYGLEVGKSTESEALSTLHELSFIDASTVQETKIGYWDPILQENLPAKLISASCKEPQERQCVGLIIAENQLKIIVLFPNYEITFLDVVDSLGSPDYVSLGLTPPVHSPSCSIGLIWKSRQIIIDHVDRSSTKLCDLGNANVGVSKNLEVNTITYFLPEYIKFQMDASEYYPWFGFIEQ
jgi:hypothetical protein